MMMRLIASRSAAFGRAYSSARRQSSWINFALDKPARAGQAESPEATGEGLVGDDVGDVEPGKRRTRFNMRSAW